METVPSTLPTCSQTWMDLKFITSHLLPNSIAVIVSSAARYNYLPCSTTENQSRIMTKSEMVEAISTTESAGLFLHNLRIKTPDK